MTLKAVEYKIKELKREYVKSEYDVDVLFELFEYEAFYRELVKMYGGKDAN